MFYEIDPELIKQEDQQHKKRWFRDSEAECDLLVWQDIQGIIKRIQFWYYDALLQWDAKQGMKTGLINRSSGAFMHYHSEIYRLHEKFDEEIISTIKRILVCDLNEDNQLLIDVKNILYQISDQQAL
jgi:hypothetical protein